MSLHTRTYQTLITIISKALDGVWCSPRPCDHTGSRCHTGGKPWGIRTRLLCSLSCGFIVITSSTATSSQCAVCKHTRLPRLRSLCILICGLRLNTRFPDSELLFSIHSSIGQLDEITPRCISVANYWWSRFHGQTDVKFALSSWFPLFSYTVHGVFYHWVRQNWTFHYQGRQLRV